MRSEANRWGKPEIWGGEHEPYWPEQCPQLMFMVQRGESAAWIAEVAEWIAAGYAGRPAHNSFAAAHNQEMAKPAAEMAKEYRKMTSDGARRTHRQ